MRSPIFDASSATLAERSAQPVLTALPSPNLGDAPKWVAAHLGGLFTGEVTHGFCDGGQTAAGAALDALDITGYARRRSMVHPPSARRASKLSPYVRYGLLPLDVVHDHRNVAAAASGDRFRYRSELLWQEYSRHWYAALGTGTRTGVTYDQGAGDVGWDGPPLRRQMACLDAAVGELEEDGWAVNQVRMWLASQWSVRAGASWREGEDWMFRHLLDGSRAANRMGWQWVAGTSRWGRYGFARAQVLKRARAYCGRCSLRNDCPIERYPPSEPQQRLVRPQPLDADGFGPATAPPGSAADVWLTAESLGDGDPALVAHLDADVHFVFDEPLLRRLRLDGKRLVFLAETLADLGTRRRLTVWRGRPADLLADLGAVAVTHAPVPGFRRLRLAADLHEHPWRWLRPPTPQLRRHLAEKPTFPNFRTWCQLTGKGQD